MSTQQVSVNLKEKSVTELKAIAYDLLQDQQNILRSLDVVYAELNSRGAVPDREEAPKPKGTVKSKTESVKLK